MALAVTVTSLAGLGDKYHEIFLIIIPKVLQCVNFGVRQIVCLRAPAGANALRHAIAPSPTAVLSEVKIMTHAIKWLQAQAQPFRADLNQALKW